MTYGLDVRREAFALLGRGLLPAGAAARLGVSAASVRGWRAQVGGVIRELPAETGRYLSRDERYEIARLHEAGVGVREIARRLGRDPGTISRELRRPQRRPGLPGRPSGRGRGYQPEACHQAALRARGRPRPSKLSQCPALRQWVQERLDQRYSPRQVAGRLRVEFPDDEGMRISHETIYRAVYVRPRGELRRELRAHLRTGRTSRRRHGREPRDGVGQISGAVPISERPEEIAERLVPGHYEGDLILGPVGTAAAIGTLVERTSGHLTAFLLPTNHTATATLNGLTAVLNSTGWPMQTLTWDRGKEMARHADFTTATGIKVYFADPYAPWQRGSNENLNGLLREYFPKGRDLATATEAELAAAVDQLNDRPRERHGFLTPNEVLAAILNNDQHDPGVATTA